MKKIILLLLIFSLILSLFSCTTTPETTPLSGETDTSEPEYTDESETGYLLVHIDKILYKLYPEEAVMVPLCPDPLCKHNTNSCPFFQVDVNVRFIGEKMYYLRRGDAIGFYSSICSFDFEKGEMEVLYEPKKNTVADLYATEGYLFFKLMILEADKDSTYKMMRYDIKTKEVLELTDEYQLGRPTILTIEGDRIYWHESGYFYSTDLEYKNRIDGDRGYAAAFVSGHKKYENINTGKFAASGPTMLLRGVNDVTGETTKVIDEMATFPILYNGSIIYVKPNEKTLIGYQKSESGYFNRLYDKTGGKFYICNSDGSKDIELCDLKGNNVAISVSAGILNGKYGVGDYVAYSVWRYKTVREEDGKNIVERISDGYVVINIKTGEYKIVGVD
ncbi:MAG: hypothetical protein E7665_09315 [Ruminococcaceae bacterium]|nr:hypothetical protein [Oscillospiraceae bacterium]